MAFLPPTLQACRKLLCDVTPLNDDCGKLCRGACCRSLPGEETGMLLFPGEEQFYQGRPGWKITESSDGLPLLVCPGVCRRDERPLSCRLFPLLPLLRGNEIKTAVDARARAVCPLQRAGRAGMREDFVSAVRACGQLLAQDEAQRAFLIRLTALHDEWKALQSTFGRRDSHV